MITEKVSLFVPFADDVNAAHWGRFGMCPMLKNLLLFRQDIVERFDVNTPSGLADAVAWMYVRALPEYDLVGMVDPETLHALNTGVSYYPSPPAGMASAIQAQPAVEVSILMGLVWRHREDVQPHFDIRTPLGRAQFCLWFVESGVAELSLQGLVSAQKREWLLGVAPRSFAPKLPRLGVLAWLARPDLQAVIDLTTAKGVTDLTVWTRKSMQTNERWQWLTNPAKSSAMSRSFDSRWLRQPVAEFGVNLIGFARGELGIGEDVRMAAQACEAAGIAYSVVNISTGENTRQGDAALADSLREVSRAPYGVNIFCLTGFDSARVFFEQGASLFASRYNIGWWPWELPVWPAEWSVAFDLMDELWAATEFTYKLYSTAAPVPTTLMPLAASVARSRPVKRQQLGLPSGRFLFLYIFDFNSYLARKNPFAALNAFRKAFARSDQSVGLVLKTMNSNPSNPVWRRFVRDCAADPRVTLLDQTLDRGDVLGLIDACDAYVSLHRSEGFGRTLAEAMLFGKPVVGTDFSGSADFLHAQTGFPVKWKRRTVKVGEYPFVSATDGAWWADPDVDDAARQMVAAKRAAGDKLFAKRVRKFAENQFSPSRIGALMRDRLEKITIICRGHSRDE